jgi:hypothetical protein
MMTEVVIENGHQVCGCVIFKFPEGRHNALRSRLDERIDDVRNAFFADGSHAGVAGGERYEAGIEMKIPDIAYLEQAVIGGLLLGGEDEGGTIWNLRVNIAVKGQVDYAVLAEGQLLEVRFRRIGSQENCAWFG